MTVEPSRIVRLVGIYNADGTVLGELRYWIGARRGSAHCSLCDITHGSVLPKRDWRQCASALPVPFETFHRNDQPDDARPISASGLPVVLAETTVGMVLLLGQSDLDRCHGDPAALVTAIERAVAAAGLVM